MTVWDAVAETLILLVAGAVIFAVAGTRILERMHL